MHISTKFTVAIHVLAASKYFGKEYKITSDFLASSIGTNPVIIRGVMKQLQSAGLIETQRGPGGLEIMKPFSDITLWDIYAAVETDSEASIFRFHEHSNPKCPIGRNIHVGLERHFSDIDAAFRIALTSKNMQMIYDTTLEKINEEANK